MYDDYEAFSLDRVPGLRSIFRSACRKAEGLSVVSRSLEEVIRQRGLVDGLVGVVPNGVKNGFGQGIDRIESRNLLGLPLDLKLVGTAGALDESRGIKDLLRAFDLLRARDPSVRLVLAGPKRGLSKALSADGIIDLGILPHARIAMMLSALDVGVVCNRDSAFGRACHPQKLVEMIACGTPVVAAAVGESSLLLAAHPDSLYPPGNHEVLARRIEAQLGSSWLLPTSLISDWQALAFKLSVILEDARSKLGASSS